MWKQCKKCGRHKALYFFYPNTGCLFGVTARCKSCQRTFERNHYKRKRNTPADLEHWKKYRESVGGKANRKKYNAKGVLTLTDNYCKTVLASHTGLPFGKITPEMIKAKREQLKLYRELKKLKGAINERTSGNRNKRDKGSNSSGIGG